MTVDILNAIWNIAKDPKGSRGFVYIAIEEEKTFDRIEHAYIEKVLQVLGFCPDFQNWVNLYWIYLAR